MDPTEPLIVKDWQKDCVYLVQYPRAGCIPSISPFSLKLETWLRMAAIPYQNVDNEFKYRSKKGLVPFVELNGRQIPDSNYAISELSRIFSVEMDESLEGRDAADFCAYHSLIEDSLYWSLSYYRSKNLSFLTSEDGVISHFGGFRKVIFRTFSLYRLKRNYKIRCKSQGIGRMDPTEIENKTKRQLKAVSIFLENKRYALGDQLTTLDATAFGHLAQFYYAPLNKDVRNFMETDCRALCDYLRNLKDEFWPDWNEATSKLSLATKPSNTNNVSSIESLTRPKLLTPVPPPEPHPEAVPVRTEPVVSRVDSRRPMDRRQKRAGGMEVFDVEDHHRP